MSSQDYMRCSVNGSDECQRGDTASECQWVTPNSGCGHTMCARCFSGYAATLMHGLVDRQQKGDFYLPCPLCRKGFDACTPIDDEDTDWCARKNACILHDVLQFLLVYAASAPSSDVTETVHARILPMLSRFPTLQALVDRLTSDGTPLQALEQEFVRSVQDIRTGSEPARLSHAVESIRVKWFPTFTPPSSARYASEPGLACTASEVV